MEWISVKDRLPEGEVLLLTSSKIFIIGDLYMGRWRTDRSYWHKLNNKNVLMSAFEFDDITHWMPLPPPPNTENEIGLFNPFYNG